MFDRQSSEISTHSIPQIKGKLNHRPAHHLSARRILKQQQLLRRRNSKQATSTNAHQQSRQKAVRSKKINQQK